jgi:hypothetical protein
VLRERFAIFDGNLVLIEEYSRSWQFFKKKKNHQYGVKGLNDTMHI